MSIRRLAPLFYNDREEADRNTAIFVVGNANTSSLTYWSNGIAVNE